MRMRFGGRDQRLERLIQARELAFLEAFEHTAALLADEVLPRKPLRQWVMSLPFALRFLLATDPEVLTHVLGIVYRAISGFILKKLASRRRKVRPVR